jgi:hypothetical protein
MIRALIAGAVLCTLALTGCMRPLPVRQTPKIYTNDIKQSTVLGYGPATNLTQAQCYLRDYETAYVEQADARITRYYKGSDTGTAGGIIGMLGGLTKSPQTAIAGLLINAGGNLEEQRYQLRVQAGNFNKAANAMRCMQRALTPSPIPSDLTNDSETEKVFTQQVNDHIDRIMMRLRDQQFSIIPNPVSTDQIRDAIKKQLEGMDERNEVMPAVVASRNKSAEEKTAALAALRAAAAKEFDGRLGQCSAG